jgi:hypothetical protein
MKIYSIDGRDNKHYARGCYVGFDNGVTGSIGIVTDGWSEFYYVPIKNELSYTKAKKFINRIDSTKLKSIIERLHVKMIAIERPMVNPKRFAATQSAMRALEATLVVIEDLKYPYRYIDSKEWQKAMLPSGLKENELKKASLDVGTRLFPQHADKFKKDADGLLIAEYLRRTDAV